MKTFVAGLMGILIFWAGLTVAQQASAPQSSAKLEVFCRTDGSIDVKTTPK